MNNWHELFRYCEGKLYWKINASPQVRIGDKAGCLGNHGYLKFKWKGKGYLAHRIIYEMAYGSIPELYQIDHVNGIRTDNRVDNLRLATRSQNNCNSSKRKDNASGFKGVNWHKASKKWRARITIFNKEKRLGCFSTKEEAYEARLTAEKKYHGEFVPSEERKLVVGLNRGNENE
jgi:hypothetical protein